MSAAPTQPPPASSAEQPAAESPEESAARLLGEVIRGTRVVVFPPGTLAASAVVPLIAVGGTGVGFLLSAPCYPLGGGATTAPAAFLWPMGIALAFGLLACFGHAAVIFGHAEFHQRLVTLVRVQLLVAIAAGVALALGRLRVPVNLIVTTLLALSTSHTLLRSRSYRGVAAFFSLKRNYRMQERARRQQALAEVKKRQRLGPS